MLCTRVASNVHHSQGSQGFGRRFGAGRGQGVCVENRRDETHFGKKLGMQLKSREGTEYGVHSKRQRAGEGIGRHVVINIRQE